MKKLLVVSLLAVVLLVGCAPGSSVEVTTPETTFRLTAPGVNPEMNQPDAAGRIFNFLGGLWHGIIAAGTLFISFFNPAVQMYEVHNDGAGYNLGFLLGVAIDFAILALLTRIRR
ncbi:MAG: hypothetical protein QM730_08475 [Anaerolineales bacterium]